ISVFYLKSLLAASSATILAAKIHKFPFSLTKLRCFFGKKVLLHNETPLPAKPKTFAGRGVSYKQ
ncbi:MAG TPA: hypothetical protein PKH93_12815, partial [Chitinophagales bacterium]|nr:hypothetical protein [Chitinophagales bacterium]